MTIALNTTQKRFEAKHANATHCDNVKAKFIVLDLVDENDMMFKIAANVQRMM